MKSNVFTTLNSSYKLFFYLLESKSCSRHPLIKSWEPSLETLAALCLFTSSRIHF